MDMCPEYERHEREFQKDVDDWEKERCCLSRVHVANAWLNRFLALIRKGLIISEP